MQAVSTETPRSARSGYDLSFTSPRSGSNKSTSSETNSTPGRKSMFLVSLIDNRAREVGFAAMNLRSSDIFLTQFVENSTSYSNTCNMLNVYDPVEIIIPNTLAASKIALTISQTFQNAKTTYVARKLYNETKGSVLINELVVPSYAPVESELLSKYLCLAAASSLIQYTQHIQDMEFAKQSLKVHYKPLSGHLMIDATSIRNLEIVDNLQTGTKKDTLMGIINHTQTPVGSRLLRSILLQPLTDLATINTRLDCIEELLGKEKLFFEVGKYIGGFIFDIDHLLAQFIHCGKSATVRSAQSLIMNIICLKKILEQCPLLGEACNRYENELFKAIATNLNNPELQKLLEEIERILVEDVNYCKLNGYNVNAIARNALNMQVQKCYAVKSGINGLLDLTRKHLIETTEEIHDLVKEYIDTTGITSMKLQYNIRRGYYLSFDANTNMNSEFNSLFIQQLKQKKKIVCSTEEINTRNTRIKDLVEEILLLTEGIVSELIAKIRESIGVLYKVSESIALMDILMSFATVVTLNSDYVRPNFTTEGPIAIKQGRHPILEKSSNAGYFVPNDTYISESGNFQIVTGPNMSGKSIYLRQIACITIMAHCGSFVPAKFASIRVVDKLFTRIGTDDSMESNASTFMVEMKEMAHIVQNATNKSLILIDELGRGTSNVEGSAIAWSICEYLMSLKAYTIFVTHYVQLTELELLYPNVKNYHLMVTTHIDGKLNFLYSVGEGSCSEARYGLKLAKMLGLPKDILEDADNICQQVLEERQKKNQSLKEKSKQTNKLRATYQLAQRILALKHSTLDLKALTIYLRKLGAQHVKPTDNQEEENS